MPIRERLTLAARVAACALAGSIAGFLAWAIGALGIGSLAWAAPLLLVVIVAFGLPSLGLLLACALVFARSIRRYPAAWCAALPPIVTVAWAASEASATLAGDGTMLIALCAVASSALFLGWSRYLAAARGTAALQPA